MERIVHIYIGKEFIKRGSDLWEITVYFPETTETYGCIVEGKVLEEFLKKNKDVKVFETETYKKEYGPLYIGPHIFCQFCGGKNLFPDPAGYAGVAYPGFGCYDCHRKREEENKKHKKLLKIVEKMEEIKEMIKDFNEE